jgi:hypothetical protein
MKEKLKINICSLAAESQLIRKEIEKLKATRGKKGADPTCQELIWHRRWHLRNESRAAQLVYAFIRDVPYRAIEPKADYDAWKWWDTKKRVKAKCAKLGVDWEEVKAWLPQEVMVG